MIHNIRFENFFSYKKETVVDFSSGRVAADDERFMLTKAGERLAKVMVCFGQNASGKTNLLKPLPFLFWFLTDSWEDLKSDEEIPIHQYSFVEERGKTRIEVESESIRGILYKYSLVLDVHRVYYESLYERRAGARWSKVFVRKIKGDSFTCSSGAARINLRSVPGGVRKNNSSVISALYLLKNKSCNDFLHSILCYSNVDIEGRTLLSYYREQKYFERMYMNKPILEKIQSVISEFDIGISRIKIRRIKSKGRKEYEDLKIALSKIGEMQGTEGLLKAFEREEYVYVCEAVHDVDGRSYVLSINDESDGTRELVFLLLRVFGALETGGVLFYDELEHGIHPNIIPRIFDIFNSPALNKKGAQLMCTCHMAEAMRVLHKSQILLVDKDVECSSVVVKLSEYKGVRTDENYVAKYLSGVYGAVPRV